MDELHSCAGNSITGCQSILLHSPFHPGIPFPLSMTQTLKINRPSNQLAIVYSEATPPRYSLHSLQLLPKCRLSIPVCCTFDGGQGSHSSKGPAQKKTPCRGVRRTCVWFCRENQLWLSKGRSPSIQAPRADNQAPGLQ